MISKQLYNSGNKLNVNFDFVEVFNRKTLKSLFAVVYDAIICLFIFCILSCVTFKSNFVGNYKITGQ